MSESIKGLFKIKLPKFHDERGYFSVLSSGSFEALPLFLQSNLSYSHRDVVRGLHFQWPLPQGKLLTVLEGSIDDFVLDIRPESPTFKTFLTIPLSAKSGESLYVPEGCAHGFRAKEASLIHYSCTNVYIAANDRGINIMSVNPSINAHDHIISEKDKGFPSLDEYLESLCHMDLQPSSTLKQPD